MSKIASGQGCDLLEKSYLCGINNNFNRILVKSLLSCDLLEKSYLCGINNNISHVSSKTPLVVICLKSLTFVVSITTVSIIKFNVSEL